MKPIREIVSTIPPWDRCSIPRSSAWRRRTIHGSPASRRSSATFIGRRRRRWNWSRPRARARSVISWCLPVADAGAHGESARDTASVPKLGLCPHVRRAVCHAVAPWHGRPLEDAGVRRPGPCGCSAMRCPGASGGRAVFPLVGTPRRVCSRSRHVWTVRRTHHAPGHRASSRQRRHRAPISRRRPALTATTPSRGV